MFIDRNLKSSHYVPLETCLNTTSSSLLAVDDVDECRLQASTADKEAVDVSLLRQFLAVLLRNTAAVQDARLLGSLVRDFLLEPLAEGLVDFLCLLRGRDLSGADGPDER
jgi:hypothetical protein